MHGRRRERRVAGVDVGAPDRSVDRAGDAKVIGRARRVAQILDPRRRVRREEALVEQRLDLVARQLVLPLEMRDEFLNDLHDWLSITTMRP